MNRFFSAALSIVLLFSFSLAGCSSEDAIQAPESSSPPTLPSVSTMSMNLSLFESAEQEAALLKAYEKNEPFPSAALESKFNFLNAAVRVLFIDVVVLTAMAEPVAAFALAIHSVPQPQSDGSYLWTYIFVDKSIEYSIFLRGKNVGEYVEWRMEVSSTDSDLPLDHFTWFEGIVNNDERSGYWQFYEPVEDTAAIQTALETLPSATPGSPCIRIDWMNGEEESELVILVNSGDSPQEGLTLEFHESATTSSIELFDPETQETGTILWHTDGSGSIEWFDYRNGEISCWDTLQFDTECE